MTPYNSRLVLVAAAAISTVQAFVAPNFSSPRQCADLKVTWSSSEFASISFTASGTPQSSVSISFIPLDIDPAHPPPPPFSFEMPCDVREEQPMREFTVPRLPFPAGTQFFASMHIPDTAAGQLARRRISDVLKVEHSSDDSCLPLPAVPEGRTRIKRLGDINKRQVRVIGQSSIDANAPVGPPTTGGNSPAIKPVGPPVFIPIDQANNPSPPANAAPGPNTGPVTTTPTPIIKELGHSSIALDGAAPPAEDAGANPPADAPPTESPTDAPPTDAGLPPNDGSNGVPQGADDETGENTKDSWDYNKDGYYDSPDSSYNGASYDDYSSPDYPSESDASQNEIGDYPQSIPGVDEWLESNYGNVDAYADLVDDKGASSYLDESTAKEYGSYDEMVNHANDMFKAWNPYKA